ncbi:hypothetical protein HMPREF9442_01602 [Paraprevotella xylaniphila YIT 11841]|uniref:Uncharacterized protein n=1 Tax=Paraprevotella xylaniphila YIT 11841 TaxID=762982 RepID=F3QTT3_9BACT|nr:hypothetical protein HMPREF9442_01602 [Paraprevotella xylaniphila YIT 11841]
MCKGSTNHRIKQKETVEYANANGLFMFFHHNTVYIKYFLKSKNANGENKVKVTG